MAKSEIKIEKTGDGIKVSIAGIIDEDVDFTQFAINGAPKIEFHLDQLKSINSCGIREWIKWIGTANESKLVYHSCPKVIVDQINMVQGFLPTNGKVESFFVPYFSEASGEEKSVLFRYGTEYNDKGVTPPSEIKDDVGNVMEMDVIENKYFKFIGRNQT